MKLNRDAFWGFLALKFYLLILILHPSFYKSLYVSDAHLWQCLPTSCLASMCDSGALELKHKENMDALLGLFFSVFEKTNIQMTDKLNHPRIIHTTASWTIMFCSVIQHQMLLRMKQIINEKILYSFYNVCHICEPKRNLYFRKPIIQKFMNTVKTINRIC